MIHPAFRRAAIAAVLLLLSVPCLAEIQHLGVDSAHSTVRFSVRHLVSRVHGTFSGFEGVVHIDPADPAGTLSFSGEVQVSTVDTGNAKRDKHLQNEDFFDSEHHRVMRFQSGEVRQTDHGLDVDGLFTMMGVTQTVTFQVEVLGFMPDPWGRGTTGGFSATTTLDRKAFGMAWNTTLDTGGLVLGDEVQVHLQIEAVTLPETE
ncbi:MAG: YceI family protein [Gemmatimonadota bacterium]|jgi:polyisoprenoid-binding protein YceI|nr:YceI family protein [Gemmatimonadota bacterium]MDP6802129.1 YceI family protein [Gemmatimonadota bacterium]MDP7032064.1 YceI family protein [Gemmatimonadota bacterium]